jgi:hypothetical protein
MFSLIITIISIALVAALAVATIYYGGSAFTQGTAKATASAFVAAGQQVSGALVLYANDNGGARADMSMLKAGNYLAAAPVVSKLPLTIDPTTNVVTASLVSDAVCDALNSAAGVIAADVPATEAAAIALSAPFSCTSTKTFVFKG